MFSILMQLSMNISSLLQTLNLDQMNFWKKDHDVLRSTTMLPPTFCFCIHKPDTSCSLAETISIQLTISAADSKTHSIEIPLEVSC